MLVKYNGSFVGTIAGHRQFTPGEVREVELDIGLELLQSPHFEEVKKTTKQAAEWSKPIKASRDKDSE